MPPLILVRHSVPEIDPTRPAAEWALSAEGQRRCGLLAERLKPYQPARVITSREPKATETGRLIAERLHLPCEVVEGLHEHERHTQPFVAREQFENNVAQFFAQPTELVMGEETAEAAHRRFSDAVRRVMEHYPAQTVTVVAHGTVITLCVAALTGLEPMRLWRRLDLPAFIVLDWLAGNVIQIVENVTDDH